VEKKKNIAILGSTGSIGTQCLDIIRTYPDKFTAEVLVANTNVKLLAEQAKEFDPNIVVIADKTKYAELSELLKDTDVKVYAGKESVEQVAAVSTVDIVLAAMVGFSGLIPVIRAIEAGKRIALANKETLVVAGEYIISLLGKNNAHIIPVDSEHSAIFQCLNGENPELINKLILTASGGPFKGKDMSFLETVSPEQALNHPNWNMGNKVSIDSASLMNKGLEVIEAHWLFGVPANKIDVIVHPQSVIHSMIEFNDASIIAQMGVPDMRIPIQYALSYPERIKSDKNKFFFTDYPQLSFEKPDIKTFRCLQVAYDALNTAGTAPCILNAANEVAVEMFLNKIIRFSQIPEIIESCLNSTEIKYKPELEDYIVTDNLVRIKAFEISKNIVK
jgi:1-deoxy-D-xylulose-5-phosphate reductoisomerase